MVFSKFISAHVSCTSLMKGSDRFMYLNASLLLILLVKTSSFP